MKKSKTRIGHISVFALILLLIILAFPGCHTEDPPPSESLSFTVTGSQTGTIFRTPEPPESVITELGNETIEVENTSDVRYDFTLKCLSGDDVVSKNFIVEAGEKHSFAVEKSSLISIEVRYEKDGSTVLVGYPFNADELAVMLSSTALYDTVIIPINISSGRFNIERPLTIGIKDCVFSPEMLYISTALEGTLRISEEGDGEFSPSNIFAEAENLTLKIPTIKKIVANPTYYLRVYAYNGRVLDFNSIKIFSEKELLDLIDNECLPHLYPDTKLTLSGNYTIESEIDFSMPVSIEFADGVTLEKAINIDTDQKCKMTFSSGKNVTLPDIPIKINAAQAQITWSIPRNEGISMLDIVSVMDVLSVNGIAPSDYVLGGESTSVLSMISLLKKNNKNLTRDIFFRADGYVLSATIDCIVDTRTLESAILTYTATNGGKVEFDKTVLSDDGTVNLLYDSGCYLNVTDKNGKTSRYLIKADYQPSALPVVVINTQSGSAVESNEEYQNATFYMNTDGCPYFDEIDLQNIQIRGRGHSTWKWDKKPYKIKFDSKVSVFGLEAHKQWVLLANYSDKSLIRNTVATEAGKILSNLSYTPTQYPVDLFFNGEYVGVYTMGEQLQANSGRVELADNGSDTDTGYLLEIGGTSSADVWNETCFYTTLCKYVKVKAPDEGTLTKEQVAFIKNWTVNADKSVMASDGYWEYIDMGALIDWVIIQELSYNIDCCFRRSCYFTKDAGGKLTMGPLWDFDNAFGNFWKDDKTYSTWATADTTSDYIWDNWMVYLINDPYFRELFKLRWDEVKYDILENMRNTVNTYSALVERSADYNFEKWDILNKRVGCEDSSIKQYNTYAKQIKYLGDFIESRWKWLDENI